MYGAILATLFYGVFSYLILTLFADIDDGGAVCEEEPYRSEAVDNAYISWTSSLCMGLWPILLALHIVLFAPMKTARKGYLSLVYMGLGYLVLAFAQRDFYTSGEGDGKRMKTFFIPHGRYTFFLTLGVWKFSFYTRHTWQVFNEDKRRKARCCCGLFEVILFEFLTIFTFLVILIASLICVFDDECKPYFGLQQHPCLALLLRKVLNLFGDNQIS